MKTEGQFDKFMYSIEEASELLSLSRAQLYRLIDQGDLETVKVGKSRRITLGQLGAFVERLEQFPTLRVIH